MELLYLRLISLLLLIAHSISLNSFVNISKSTPEDGLPYESFGNKVSLHEDVLVVGAPGSYQQTVKGSAYVYENEEGSWVFKQKLQEDKDESENFASGVAVFGNVTLVGCGNDRLDGASGNKFGSVFVYEKVDSTWELTANLLSPDSSSSTSERFGISVAIYNDIIVAGEPGDSGSKGAVHIFEKVDGEWTATHKLVASDRGFGDSFGSSVAIHEDWIAVSAPRNLGFGAVYVFSYGGSSWTQAEKLVASNKATDDSFGTSVAIHDEVIVVGADRYNIPYGKAYIFEYDGSDWNEEKTMTSTDQVQNDRFGFSVATFGKVALVGASRESGEVQNMGFVYVYQKIDGEWELDQKLFSHDVARWDDFGLSVAIGQSLIVVGAPGDDDNSKTASGSFYTFASPPNVTSSYHNLQVNDTIKTDWFYENFHDQADFPLVSILITYLDFDLIYDNEPAEVGQEIPVEDFHKLVFVSSTANRRYLLGWRGANEYTYSVYSAYVHLYVLKQCWCTHTETFSPRP